MRRQAPDRGENRGGVVGRLLDRDPRILPEMGARVDFLAAPDSGASGPSAAAGPPRFRLPAGAVRDAGRRSSTATSEARGRSAGLSGGERVMTGGVDEPKEGMRVKSETESP